MKRTTFASLKKTGNKQRVPFLPIVKCPLFDLSPHSCYSSVGRIGGRQVISLGEGCHCKGTVIHEVMHALGFWHEQSRSDRDEYVFINFNNVISGQEGQFYLLKPDENRLFSTSYDYESIMQYPEYAFSRSPEELKTIIPRKEGVKLRDACDKNQLSDTDIVKLTKLYQC